jgi:hypothetical protein
VENIQRTLRLLDESQAGTLVGPVRVLFYGQSITQSAWSRKVEQTLRARYPRATLQVENRALGGFPAQLLVEAAESDLYPAYPDLVIFHVYGDHHRYEDIVRSLRERTTAELLLQTDHVTRAEDLDEPTDERQLAPNSEQWSAFMNGAFLPGLATRYGAALCDQRSAWKRELRARGLAPSALLLDDVHLNGLGDALMASLVESCLRRDRALDPAPAEAWVRTLGHHDLIWSEAGELRVVFEGNRIDAVVAAGGSTLDVSIDGAPPSRNPALYTFARAHAREGGKWPPITHLRTELAEGEQRYRETFTLEVTQQTAAEAGSTTPVYTFRVRSDETGADGSGRSDVRFVSTSRRLVIEPEDWKVAYTFQLADREPPPTQFTIDVRVEPKFTDRVAGVPASAAGPRMVTLAQGLANTQHTLLLRRVEPRDVSTHELRSTPLATLLALRVYRPPLGRH